MSRYHSAVYKSAEGEKLLKALYEKHLNSITAPYTEQYVDTRFGNTHIVKYGNPSGIPVLGFHGGNSINPYSLRPLTKYADLNNICLIVPDTIGNIGLSAERRLSSRTLDYGKWASDICDALSLNRIAVFGGSFGAGIALRFAAYAPQRVDRLLLVVPSGIANASGFKMLKVIVPAVSYMLSPGDARKLTKVAQTLMPFPDDDFMEMTAAAIKHTRYEMAMPKNARLSDLKRLTAPVYVIAEKYDMLFPGEKVLARAKRLFPNLTGTMLLETGGHAAFLHNDGKRPAFFDAINAFLIWNV